MTDITKPPEQWQWTCARCHVVSDAAPSDAPPQITLRELEAMVDSSLRLADRVICDDQTVKGELWLMRNAHWHYYPMFFQILYHVFHGWPFVLLFNYRLTGTETNWQPVRDTDTYRELLLAADRRRRLLV